MKTEIIKILRNSDTYVSGQQLCNNLGVSRTAIWKVMNQLKEEGYEIEAVSNKGYRLIHSSDVISESEILSRMQTNYIGKKVRFYDEVDSTNLVAKKIAEEEESDGLLVVSESQTKGKGRRGREWSSDKGCDIFMSLILKPKINPMNASMLTILAALAVSKSIAKIVEKDTYIKWPNDIILNNKKVCGVLTEMSTEIDYINHVVIGIGINVNRTSFPNELASMATSLYVETEQKVQRAELIASVVKEFEEMYLVFLEIQTLQPFMKEYNDTLINAKRQVKIIEYGKEYEAIAIGINEKGELMIHDIDHPDHVRTVLAGEVSVRGIYNYV
ncbi:biotin--[acetyl-CoA-carboxylase] ligase [Anaeromicropila herbilytica]|uniref:Bifunctional ligase/repressor BirA n=1 Tax=Anaeromicropila herbilytica TaxID=2785025 RepID=A0A7R7EJ38_9FIRM|nr:biotin--[acetyl-CoA-carboxylase] ligase [Anaeromicropila herbilytica]BCN29700.1 bifunctional ligase/repressor BirA [Anaeromicropila herbilytica]